MKWSKEETDLFIKLYSSTNTSELIEIFNRSESALESKASKLGIRKIIKENGDKPFTKEEIEYLKINYGKKSVKEIAIELNRQCGSVRWMAEKLSLKSSSWWTEDEIKFLIDNYSDSQKEILEINLNKRWKAINKKARLLGLKRYDSKGNPYAASLLASESEDDYIKINYENMTSTEMAKTLNRTICFVEDRCRLYNLKPKRMRKNPNDYSNEKLLFMLKEFEKELGRTPIKSDIENDNRFPAIDIYYDRFGTLSNAFILAGIDVELRSSFGKRCLSKNGDICYSFYEKIITDFLIEKKICYEKDVYYKRLVPDLEKNYRMDWLLYDGTIVEFFGLMFQKEYRNKTEKKINICKRHNIRIIEVFEKDIADLNTVFKEYL